MGRRKEYIAARYHAGTTDRVDALRDYAGAQASPAVVPDLVDRSEVMRMLIDFALEVFERRAQTWRAEQRMAEHPKNATRS